MRIRQNFEPVWTFATLRSAAAGLWVNGNSHDSAWITAAFCLESITCLNVRDESTLSRIALS